MSTRVAEAANLPWSGQRIRHACRGQSLREIGDAAAVPTLIEALNDSSNHFLCMVIETLGKIGDTAAVPALVAMLKDRDSASDPPLRSSAAEVLGKIGDVVAVPALIAPLDDKTIYCCPCINAAEALQKMGDLHTLPRRIIACSRFSAQKLDAPFSRRAFPSPGGHSLHVNNLAEDGQRVSLGRLLCLGNPYHGMIVL